MRRKVHALVPALLAVLAFTGAAKAQDGGESGSHRVVIVSATQAIIQVNASTVDKIAIAEAGSETETAMSFKPVKPVGRWIIAKIESGTLKFESNSKYVLTLTLNDGKKPPSVGSIVLLPVDTSSKVKLRASAGLPLLEGNVAFSLRGSNAILSNNDRFCGAQGQSVPVEAVEPRNQSNTEVYFAGISSPLAESKLCEISLNKLDEMPDADGVGRLALRSSKGLDHNVVPLSGVFKDKIVSVLGNNLVFEQPTGESEPAPATKDAAWLWLNGTVTAGTGSAPAWVLDGKLQPPLQFWWEGIPVTPLNVTANIGNNKVGGVSAKDVIDFEVPSLTWLPPVIHDDLRLQVPASLTFETNRAFDHRNLLGVGDLIWTWRGLDRLQVVRTAEALYQEAKDKNSLVIKMPPQGKYGKGGYATMGWRLLFHTGFEAGGALTTSTVTNPKTKALIGVVPTYSIARFVPEIDGMLQVRGFSIESAVTGRYLFAAEHTAVNNKAGIPYLETVEGWKAQNVLTGTWTPFANQNVGFTAAYANGFCAPTYQRANGVKLGVLVKF